jgi:hypothetical protein
MSSTSRRLRVLLSLVAAACPAVASALAETYAGVLLPESTEGPIPVIIELREVGSILTGKVDAGFPLSGKAAISSGENRSGECKLKVVLNNAVTLRLQGSCRPALFEGKYTVYHTLRNTESRGTFRLTRKAPEEAKKITSPSATASTSVTACQKANVHCLTTCPRGDPDTEFLCANHCRSRLQACRRSAANGPVRAP